MSTEREGGSMNTPQVTILTRNEIQAKLTALEGLVVSLSKCEEGSLMHQELSDALAALLKHGQEQS